MPFYLRAGKCLPVTRTEVLARFRKPPSVIPAHSLWQNYLRFRVSPEVELTLGVMVKVSGDEMAGQSEGVGASVDTFPNSFAVNFVTQEERPGGPSCGFAVTVAAPACGGACVN